MDIVAEQIHAISNRLRRTLTGVQPTEPFANTFLGTWDGADSTRDQAQDSGNGTVPPSLVYSDDYTMSAALFAGEISVVRVRLRRSLSGDVGPQLVGQIQPLINNVARGTPETTVSAAYSEVTWNFTTDPADSQPWTLAKINSYKWGFKALVSSPNGLTALVQAQVSEVLVDVLTPDDPLIRLTQRASTVKLTQEVRP